MALHFNATVNVLSQTAKGSLIQTRKSDGTSAWGFRAEQAGIEDDPPSPGLVLLELDGAGNIRADLWVPQTRRPTVVISYGSGWQLDVPPGAWGLELVARTFSASESGSLLLGYDGAKGLQVKALSGPSMGDCLFLDLNNWSAVPGTAAAKYSVATCWGVYVPRPGNQVDWLFRTAEKEPGPERRRGAGL